MDGRLASLFNALRLSVAAERLPAAPAEDPPRPSRGGRSLLGLLFGREVLATEPEPPAPARSSLLVTILAPERLPADPPAPTRARTPWLAWLTRLERLDDD